MAHRFNERHEVFFQLIGTIINTEKGHDNKVNISIKGFPYNLTLMDVN